MPAKPKDDEQGRHEKDDDTTPPCEVCWPGGWDQVDQQHPGLAINSVGCGHGIYQR